jgi:hypothetical protein
MERKPYRDFDNKGLAIPMLTYENKWVSVAFPGADLKLTSVGPGLGDHAATAIDRDVATGENGYHATLAAADDRTHTCPQLVELEGLDEVVVGACVEAVDAFAQLIARRENQDRCRVVAASHRPQHRQARLSAWQAQVQQHGGVGMVDQGDPGGGCIADAIDGPAALACTVAHGFTQHVVVFYEEQVHESGISCGRTKQPDDAPGSLMTF